MKAGGVQMGQRAWQGWFPGRAVPGEQRCRPGDPAGPESRSEPHFPKCKFRGSDPLTLQAPLAAAPEGLGGPYLLTLEFLGTSVGTSASRRAGAKY